MIRSKYTAFIQLLKYTLLLLCFVPMSLLGQCTENGNYWNKSWVSCQKTITPSKRTNPQHWIQYEFNEPQSIDSIRIWNANRPGESDMGVRAFRVDYSVDGVNWVRNAISINLPKANEQDDYEGVQIASGFEDVFVQKIVLVLVNTHGGTSCASIAEAQFKINSDACYGILDACGVCDGSGKATWYIDADGDGLGHIDTALEACNQPAGYVDNADDYCDNGLLGWNEVSAIFKDNGCTGCHGDSGLGGLRLTSYEAAIAGGNKCGSNILSGTTLTDIITTGGYAGCGTPIGQPSMNDRVGGNIDDTELALIQDWVDAGAPLDCNCLAGAPDADNDETCDAIDECPNFDNRLIGTPCDDGLVCTENDVWTSACECAGKAALDSDNDGVCDTEDAAPNDACTADGTIDGMEPDEWIALPTNDCDADGINNVNNDLNDFNPCIDYNGRIGTVACNCASEASLAGGKFADHANVGGIPTYADGLPDGIMSGYIGGTDSLILSFPYLALGEEICITVGFSDVNGKVNFSVNNNSFTYLNANGSIDYLPQEFCFKTLNAGPQTVVVQEVGAGGIRVDGSTYAHCPCSLSDPKFETPDCNCIYDTATDTGTYLNSVGISNAANADGAPDGTFTGSISWTTDTLNLYFSTLIDRSEICVTLGFSDPNGMAVFDLGGELFYFPNLTGDTEYAPQQFCIPSTASGAQTLEITERGSGVIRVDGSTQKYCTSCQPNIAGNISIKLSAYLEGAYNPTLGEMTNKLNVDRGLLPGQQPVSDLATPTPAGQPYHLAPWNYIGTQGISWTNEQYTGNEVDWVLVSFRTDRGKDSEVAMTAALLNKDGSISFPDRCILPKSSIDTPLHVVIEHRNHIGIMSPQPIDMTNGVLSYDFRASDSFRDPTSFGQKQLPTGEWVMYAGDANQIADIISYDITGADKTEWFENNGVFDYYLSPDFNLDGDVNGQDKAMWYLNNGISSRVPK